MLGSLEQLALRLLASRSSRKAAHKTASAMARETNSAPASPRPRAARNHPDSPAPASPAPRSAPRRPRYSSASPIRLVSSETSSSDVVTTIFPLYGSILIVMCRSSQFVLFYRQLLNSPLLNRRRNKKPSESSDDEYSTGGGYSEVNGRNYRDLESFQKAQLRNKVNLLLIMLQVIIRPTLLLKKDRLTR